MAEPIDEHFITTIAAMADPATPRPSQHQSTDAASHLSAQDLLDLFDSQIGSRHLDLAARWLRAQGKGFYTIGSSGHESNAAVAAALRPTDPALLHYRSGGFFLAPGPAGRRKRSAARRAPRGRRGHRGADLRWAAQGLRPPRPAHHPPDVDDRLPPAARGRGGVLHRAGRQTGRRTRRGRPTPSRSAASATRPSNHSTAVGAINTAIHAAYQGLPLPLLFVCEDNGIGISTKTPQGWIDADLRKPAAA